MRHLSLSFLQRCILSEPFVVPLVPYCFSTFHWRINSLCKGGLEHLYWGCYWDFFGASSANGVRASVKLGLGTFCTMVRFLVFLTIFPLLSLFSFIYLFCVLPTNGKKVALHSQALNVSFISIFNFLFQLLQLLLLVVSSLSALPSLSSFFFLVGGANWRLGQSDRFFSIPTPARGLITRPRRVGPRWPLRLVQITEPIMERLGKIKQQHSWTLNP